MGGSRFAIDNSASPRTLIVIRPQPKVPSGTYKNRPESTIPQEGWVGGLKSCKGPAHLGAKVTLNLFPS